MKPVLCAADYTIRHNFFSCDAQNLQCQKGIMSMLINHDVIGSTFLALIV
ncbi:hypothetical protein HMPREF0880_04393 [Yokenella regensburgei ATCC 43003]|nr:hypothetical protein HMPREF0880_04393 [Yokenella regensburgei ATCC 43003]